MLIATRLCIANKKKKKKSLEEIIKYKSSKKNTKIQKFKELKYF